MAANAPTPAETPTKATLTTKQSKAMEKISISSSAPWNKPSLKEVQIRDSSNSCWSNFPSAKPDLKPMQTLAECLQLLHKLAEEVHNISQESKVKRGSKMVLPQGGAKEPSSLESSRSLILQWATDLELNMVNKEAKPMDAKARRRDAPGKTEKNQLEKHNDRFQQWAVELRNIKEANGVSDEELRELLYPRGPKESRMAAILPLLEFVAWSLLSEDTEEEALSMLWLPTKHKAWRTGSGSPRYIPNSVWQWIQSASVSVKLDVSTRHPWLVVSPDHLQVREAASPATLSPGDSRHFAEWPCVLGDAVIAAGRHYWEVEVSPKGSWRIGVASVSAPRNQRSTMSPKRGYWTLWRGSSLWACTDKPTKLQRAAVPRRIGVYVDVTEDQVSFYDVDRRVHIYTFSDTFRHGLIPLFGCLDGDTVLKIVPRDASVATDDGNTQDTGSL